MEGSTISEWFITSEAAHSSVKIKEVNKKIPTAKLLNNYAIHSK